jgi:hypothetical protein
LDHHPGWPQSDCPQFTALGRKHMNSTRTWYATTAYEVLHFAYMRAHRESYASICVLVLAIIFISSSQEPAETPEKSELFSSVGDNLHPITTYFRVLYDTAPLKSRWVQLKSSLVGGLLVGLGYIKRGVHCIPMAIAREEFRYLTS